MTSPSLKDPEPQLVRAQFSFFLLVVISDALYGWVGGREFDEGDEIAIDR